MESRQPDALLASLGQADWRYGIRAFLAHFERLGITHLPAPTLSDVIQSQLQTAVDGLSETVPVTIAEGLPPAVSEVRTAPTASVTRPTAPLKPAPVRLGNESYRLPVLDSDQRRSYLETAQQTVCQCVRCPILAGTRKQTVFGEGNVRPRVVFFGEAPGADEDRIGRPFVGRAGELLNRMIEACTFAREDCYILNTIKCRPPENRNPTLDEVENCREFFELQLDVLQPQYIVCLGLVAARALLRVETSVGRLRGQFHRYCNSQVLVTYHPSYLLRYPEAKRAAWEDLQILLRDMGIDPKAGKK